MHESSSPSMLDVGCWVLGVLLHLPGEVERPLDAMFRVSTGPVILSLDIHSNEKGMRFLVQRKALSIKQ